MGTFKQTKIYGQHNGTSSPSVGVVKNLVVLVVYHVLWDSMLTSFHHDLRA